MKLRLMSDVLSETKIKFVLKTKLFGKRIYAFWSIGSTNDFAYRLAMQGEDEGALVIAEQQERGRGRKARVWDSQFGKGLWLSVILRPDLPSSNAGLIPYLAGVSVSRAVEDLTGLQPEMKWPNDVMLNNMKCCGVLSEVNFKNGKIDFIILGIGINVNHEAGEWSDEIDKIATSLRIEKNERLERADLLAEILFQLEQAYDDVKKNGFGQLLDQWKKRCPVFQQNITILQEDKKISGTFINLDEKGCLLLKGEDGKIKKIVAGDLLV
ncbi:biotin--[acetyl-CoA-carboxylase] ligase [candidate division KSB1 bacterium]|nr:biotin--[acetyl-CoA-carboxylase] ligase [candidate division KSB1 bacterium]MBL7093351.1 biotin--[acetyl-CoA-carboxylase] ligase [candidate division KSB1 bacterium]